MPSPWKRKSLYRQVLIETYIDFTTGVLNNNSLLTLDEMYSAAFKRLQVTSKSLKNRLVFAVNYKLIAIFKPLDIMFKSSIRREGGLVIGCTQKEISSHVSEFKNMYAYSMDGKAFDHHAQTLILLIAFYVLEDILKLSPKQLKTFRYCRNLELVMPLFHPDIRYTERHSGLSSGSGVTNTIGSIAMYLMLVMCLFRYYSSRGTNIWRTRFLVKVSGDDSIVGTLNPIDISEFTRLFSEMFTIELELELSSNPGENKVVFLGSR